MLKAKSAKSLKSMSGMIQALEKLLGNNLNFL